MPLLLRYRRPLLWVLGTLLALALVLVSHPPGRHSSVDQGLAMGVVTGRVLPVPTALRVPHPVRVALQVQDLRGMDLSTKTFNAQGQVWLEWDAALQARLRNGELDPLRLVRFVNQVEGWNSIFEPVGPAQAFAAPGGGGAERGQGAGAAERFSQTFRFEGLFYVNGIDLHGAPFLEVSLPLILEVADAQLAIEADGLLLEPLRDPARQTGGGVAMAGFDLEGSAVMSALHRTENPFHPGRFQTFSRVVLRLDYRTDQVASALRWILPLMLVMAVVLLAPSLDSGRDDLSFGLPSAGLLTLVVLQEGYRSQVPPTPYLTFLDQLYAYSYAVAVAVFLLFVWGGNLRARAADGQAAATLSRVNGLCTVVQGSALVGYGVILLGHALR
jgi:hypothetical protein